MFSTEAMDRIHRLGQRRPVRAIKLVIEDSIESRIVQVCINLGTVRFVSYVDDIAAREKECNGGCDLICG